MKMGKVFEAFIEKSPISVMARAALEHLFDPDRLNRLFEKNAKVQYTRQLLFSMMVDLLGQVVLEIHPSIHSAYQAQAKEIRVSDQAVYDKLNHVEPEVSAELVRDSARRAIAITQSLQAALPPLLKGYHTRILDGNHLASTEHRIKELRTTWSGPLPGQLLVVLDREHKVVLDVFPCEDGHAQERTLLDKVLAVVHSWELWIADRNFCTAGFLTGIADRSGSFVIRQHSGLSGECIGECKSMGSTETGEVYEQSMSVKNADGHVYLLRRITVQLKKATRDGDTEMHILTNLPTDVADAQTVANLYLKRWNIETMFQELTQTLTCEIKTLGYPKAALFGFCLAVVAYHAVSIIKAALRSVHGEETIEKNVSGYYLSLEIRQTYSGMMIAIPDSHWKLFRSQTPEEMADILKILASKAELRRYKKHSRGPKKPQPEKTFTNGGHVSTAKLLAKRKGKS